MSSGRAQYWQLVSVYLAADHGLKCRNDDVLHWLTLEVLAEGNGFLRKNVTHPVDMARTVSRFFRPREA